MDTDQELRSLRRGLTALTLINQTEAMSIARMAAALDLPRTTAERILNTLAADGYLERSIVDKMYRLTPKVLALSSGFSGESWITHIAAPLLNATTEDIGWPMAIAIPEGPDMRVRYTTDTLTSLWLNRRRVGASIPIPRASSGSVFLAFAAPSQAQEVRRLVAQVYPSVQLDEVHIEQARRCGYAFSPLQTREQSVSLPIFLDGKIAAVVLMIFMARVHTHADVIEKYLPRLKVLAKSISDRANLASHEPLTQAVTKAEPNGAPSAQEPMTRPLTMALADNRYAVGPAQTARQALASVARLLRNHEVRCRGLIHVNSVRLTMERGVPVRSISRSIAVLQCINRGGALSMMEIARLTSVPYPTVFRIMQTLMHEGLVECEPERKRYHATCRVESLAAGYREDGRLVDAAHGCLVELTRKVGWPVTLSSTVGTSVVVRACTHDISPLMFSHYYRGDAFPLLECAPGHVHLAFSDEASRSCLLNALEKQYQHSVALEMFRSGRLTRRIQEDGYAGVARTEHTKNPGKTSSISVPLPTGHGKLAHLSINFFASAMSVQDAAQRYLPDLRATAAAVIQKLAEHEAEAQALAERAAVPAAKPRRKAAQTQYAAA